MGNLAVDFYESGVGDTIVVTFPSGGIGIVDAHPSTHSTRPPITDIIRGKKVHFVCLTHPHEDHGADLVGVLRSPESIAEFWSPVPDIPFFTSFVKKFPNFRSPEADWARSINKARASVFLSLFAGVSARMIDGTRPFESGPFSSDHQPKSIDGVEVHCLTPTQSILNQERSAYAKRMENPTRRLPNPNPLSIVLALHYGGTVVVLGADAYKNQWTSALQVYRDRKLPKALLLKVPHHGAANSFNFGKGGSYLDLCNLQGSAKAVIFAGDCNHPNEDVFNVLRDKLQVVCLGNGLKLKEDYNPLDLTLPGAAAEYPAPVCNPRVSFEICEDGAMRQTAGACLCSDCFPCLTSPRP